MERPQSSSSHRGDCHLLAEALLCTEQTLEAHEQLLREAFHPEPPRPAVKKLAALTLAWMSRRPPWRARLLARRLQEQGQLRRWWERRRFVLLPLPRVPLMRRWPDTENLPALTTIGDLAQWLRIDVPMLSWMADLEDRNRHCAASALQHYTVRRLSKRDGTARVVEAPKQLTRHVQRQILREILNAVAPHDAAHGFRKGRSIRTFAAPHAGRAMVLRLDLQHFFASITGARVQAMFRTLGYPEAVADLLGGLCTTTTPRAAWATDNMGQEAGALRALRDLYGRPHLPQGAPSSPAIANLCARRMDLRLTGLANAAGVIYTRYADDLAFSGNADFVRQAERFVAHVAAVVAEEGFRVNHRKTRIMRSSACQRLAGVVINQEPGLRRKDLERLEATLVNCVRRGPAGQNRENHPNFRAHLEGKVAYISMLNARHARKLQQLLQQVAW